MDGTVEMRLVEVLRRQPTYTLPVRALHGALVAELGPGPGTYVALTDALRRRPDLFMVMEPRDPLGGAPALPADARAEYEAALRAAGFDAEPRVVLVAPAIAGDGASDTADAAVGPSALACVDASLVALWAAAANDARLRAALSTAITEVGEIRRLLAQEG